MGKDNFSIKDFVSLGKNSKTNQELFFLKKRELRKHGLSSKDILSQRIKVNKL